MDRASLHLSASGRAAQPGGDSLPAWLGASAALALAEEASLPGKPGLVGPGSKGAHDDMDLGLMLRSADVLEPFFAGMALLAAEAGRAAFSPGDPPGGGEASLLVRLRPLGLRAEAAMFSATNGVNTHKGAIFSMGLLVSAAAFELSAGLAADPAAPLADRVRSRSASIARGIVARELQRSPTAPSSAGERAYRAAGVSGARGQAEAGYPIVGARILPPLRRARNAGPEARARAAIEALLGAMCDLDDTCVLSRGGPEGLAFLQSGAADALSRGAASSEEGQSALLALDAALVARHLSPGGAADLLAAGLFLDRLETALSA